MLAVNDLHLIVSSPHDKLLRKAIETVYKAHNVNIRTFDFQNSTYSDIDELLLKRVPTNVIEFNPDRFLQYLENTTVEPLKRVGIWAILPTDSSVCHQIILSLEFAVELKIPIYFFLPQASHISWKNIMSYLPIKSVEILKKNQRRASYFTPIDFSKIIHSSQSGLYTSILRSTYRTPMSLVTNILELLGSISAIVSDA
jgi:hypothetical protein